MAGSLPQATRSLTGAADLDPLLERIGDARVVLLGEASHGTHEYYAWRSAITRRLVEEKRFDFVAVEGDWPDCFAINAWIRHLDDDRDAVEVLEGFQRWPTWMWANEEIAQLIRWMRARNRDRDLADQVGFYGFDVYSLWDSMRAILDYLEQHEPDAVGAARAAAGCFEPYQEDPQAYAVASRLVPETCEEEVVALLGQLLRRRDRSDGAHPERRFAAEQNAHVVHEAERYYRAMIRGGPDSWNVRDTHMVDTLDRLLRHHGRGARAIVWTHNTHVGDARATDMADQGLVNVGQLVRERYGADDVVAVGFACHRGSVIAGEAWGAPMERMPVPPARPGSVEDLLHDEVGADSLLVFPRHPTGWLASYRPHRAIGVVYRPEREAFGNYVPTEMGRRYDALLWLERTSALRPLVPELPAVEEDLETYPSGV